MNKTQAGRLLTLAKFLRTQVPAQNFDMGSFWWDWKNPKKLLPPPDLTEQRCGTTACALGWGTVVWPEQFQLTSFGRVESNGENISVSCDIVCDFFGVDINEAVYLFACRYSRTPIQEAVVIENLVKQKGFASEEA